jgi:hypothetical protein
MCIPALKDTFKHMPKKDEKLPKHLISPRENSQNKQENIVTIF